MQLHRWSAMLWHHHNVLKYILPVVAFFSVRTMCATADEWRRQSIYQVVTDRFSRTDNNYEARCNATERLYCGGTYRGLIQNLDYIQDMGFSAVWIAPIVRNIQGKTGWGEAYHGYWQEDINRMNDNFGSEDDLKDLSSELHRRGMYLMVDVVVNHFATSVAANLTDYSRYRPFDKSDFHPFCKITDYDNQTNVENCWIGDERVWLADVKTEKTSVMEIFNEWIKELVPKYSIDGLRLDTAKHVQKSFFPGFLEAAGVFASGEVWTENYTYFCNYQNYMDSMLNHGIYYPLTRAFGSTSGSVSELVRVHQEMQTICKDTTVLLNFASNHDIARLASLAPSPAHRKNILAYTMLSDGIPLLYQGDEQGYAGKYDPENREAVWLSGFDQTAPLYQLVQRLNKLRAWAGRTDDDFWTSFSTVLWSDEHNLALRKGSGRSQIVTVMTNRADNNSIPKKVRVPDSGFRPGTILLDVVACAIVRVGSGGALELSMTDGDPKVFFPLVGLRRSGICGSRRSKRISSRTSKFDTALDDESPLDIEL